MYKIIMDTLMLNDKIRKSDIDIRSLINEFELYIIKEWWQDWMEEYTDKGALQPLDKDELEAIYCEQLRRFLKSKNLD